MKLTPMTLEDDHALLAGITEEMIEAAVRSELRVVFTRQVEFYLGLYSTTAPEASPE